MKRSRISAFEALSNPSSSSAAAASASLSPTLSPSLSPPRKAPYSPHSPTRIPNTVSPSPSPPNLGRKTSLIDLKDWIIDDGPESPRKHFGNDGRTPTRHDFDRQPQLIAPLIQLELESPPKAKPVASPTVKPPLPPRKPSYTSLKSVSSSTSSHSVPASPRPPPPRRLDSLTVDHTYPPLKIDVESRSRNSSGHAPASSISSFHSVSLSSDTDPSTPGSVSPNHISTFPMDLDSDHKHASDIDSVSLGESYEEVSTPPVTSPATERYISRDWEMAMANRRQVPPRHPQRPNSNTSNSSSSIQTILKSQPPKRDSSSSSTLGSPGLRASVSSVSSISSTSTLSGGPMIRKPPPPPPSRSSDRSSDRLSIQSTATSFSISSSQGHAGSNSRSATTSHLKVRRPTPVPASARLRYDAVFNANIVQRRKAEKQKAKEKPALLSPEQARGTSRRAAGWRGLSVDLITGEDIAVPGSSQDDAEVDEDVGPMDRLEGNLVKTIWRRSRLSRRTLGEIWYECDPDGGGSLTRDQFAKGMWRVDEELRRAQLQALKTTSTGSLGSLRANGRSALKPPPIPQRKPILR
ncbi:hypothetical protein H0H93_011739 [Arthromyces matolae]|nr:hypothetical protein H0H93_011739 [Arthromyces matolae]